jgi:predicted transcriptional regulator
MDELPDLNRGDESSKDEVAASAGEREQRLAAIRAAVERGLEDVKAGRVTDLDAAFDRIETMLDEIEAAKRG